MVCERYVTDIYAFDAHHPLTLGKVGLKDMRKAINVFSTLSQAETVFCSDASISQFFANTSNLGYTTCARKDDVRARVHQTRMTPNPFAWDMYTAHNNFSRSMQTHNII